MLMQTNKSNFDDSDSQRVYNIDDLSHDNMIDNIYNKNLNPKFGKSTIRKNISTPKQGNRKISSEILEL